MKVLFTILIVSTISSFYWPYILLNRILSHYGLQRISISQIRPQILPIIKESTDTELKRKLKNALRIIDIVNTANFLLLIGILSYRYVIAYFFG